MFHLELYKFPNAMARFNLSAEEMAVVVVPWARGEWVELGERKWNPQEARLTVLEGPAIPVQQLRVGRGWRLAQRQADDVTQQVIAAARDGGQGAGEGAAPGASAAHAGAGADVGARADADAASRGGDPVDQKLLADSIGLELLTLLHQGPLPLAAVWALVAQRLPMRPASETLALAEDALAALHAAGLIVLCRDRDGNGDGNGERTGAHAHVATHTDAAAQAEALAALTLPASWCGENADDGLFVRGT